MNLDGMTFGPFHRFALHWHQSQRALVPSCWMVLDAEEQDPLTGSPEVVRQFDTTEEALAFVESQNGLLEVGLYS